MARGKTTAGAADSAPTQTALALPADQVTVVFNWILEGNNEYDVREAIAKELPGADASALIVAAVQRFADAGKFDPAIMFGWCAEAYREIYRVARNAGDAPTMLRAVKLLSQLAGAK